MNTDANVVPLTPASAPQAPNAAVSRLPVALVQLRDKATQQLKDSLQSLFENADDTLFGLADRASSNAEQNAFFEAMRDLRLKRKSIEQGFLQHLFQAFAALNQYKASSIGILDAVASGPLSLVQDDELEEAVAVDAMVAKVLSRDGKALRHLSLRMNTLISQRIDDKTNPLGPAVLSQCFLQACSGLGVQITVKLIVLKLFEKYVLGGTEQLYAQANEWLVSAGVLPELHDAPPRAASRRPAPVAAAPSATGADWQGDDGRELHSAQEMFSTLQGLLSQMRALSPQRSAHPADAMPITSGDLMRLLSHLQRAPQVQQAEQSEADLRQQLEMLLARASAKTGKTRVVGEVDEDVINLVSMLFEFILDDRTLPDSLKALIGRMQIPMLKVAVLDKRFFSSGNHPARRLLNEIASAALGWSECDDVARDALYQRIDQVVQRLINDFTDDPAIFSELLAEFIAFTGSERRRSELLEQRMRDAEEGSAKAELARREVEQALNHRLLGRTLPQVVVNLLQEAWSKVLMLACLKHGAESAQWQQALSVMDDLIWSVEPHDEPEARPRLLALVPPLLKALRDGMSEAALDPFATNAFFTQLEALHVQALQRQRPVLTPVATPVSDAQTVPENLTPAAESESEPVAMLAPLLESPMPAPVEVPLMVEVLEEIVLLAPGQTQLDEPEVQVPEDDACVLQVDNLRVGSWVEFAQGDDSKMRCKLAAIVKVTGKYVFVNRTGMKVLEKSRMGLAVEFRRGSVRMLDDALLFDRALESVIGNLRRLKNT